MNKPLPCDVFKIADQVGVRLPPMARARKVYGDRECFARKTLKLIGQSYGEPHLALVLRLIVESRGNAAELYSETLNAVSAVLSSGTVEVGSALFEAFDGIDLRVLRAWAKQSCPEMTTADAMAAVILWQLGADRVSELRATITQAREKEAAAKAKRLRERRRAQMLAKRQAAAQRKAA